MSKINKAICDNCGKEIDYKDWYYNIGSIVERTESYDKGRLILNGGDYCKTCFNNIIAINEKAIKIKGDE